VKDGINGVGKLCDVNRIREIDFKIRHAIQGLRNFTVDDPKNRMSWS
jgi:hypothetical protein